VVPKPGGIAKVLDRSMRMIRIPIQVPASLKAKLDEERRRGTTASGLIRRLLELHFKGKRAA